MGSSEGAHHHRQPRRRGEPAAPLVGFTVGVVAARRGGDLAALLERAGARVVRASVRPAAASTAQVPAPPAAGVLPPVELARVRRLVRLTVRHELDALAFFGALGVEVLLGVAATLGQRADLVDALRTDVMAVCSGPVSARPLTDALVPAVWPDRSRLGALAHCVAAALPARDRHHPTVVGGPRVAPGAVAPTTSRTTAPPPVSGARPGQLPG